MGAAQHLNLRGQRVVVVHPPERDCDELVLQLSRIGLVSEVVWPPAKPSHGARFAFLALGIDRTDDSGAVRIAVMDRESPTDLAQLLNGSYDGVIVKPFRPGGLLSMLSHASQSHDDRMELLRRLRAHEQKLLGFRKVERAKEFLMRERAISGDDAFAMIRRMAMDRRKTVEDIAVEIVEAEKLLKTLHMKD